MVIDRLLAALLFPVVVVAVIWCLITGTLDDPHMTIGDDGGWWG